MNKKVDLSIVIPIFNEQDNIEELANRIYLALNKIGIKYEVIVVDDGSTDKTFSILHELSEKHMELRSIQLRRNFGQTAAMQAGIDHSTGKYICFLDGDLQNDPDDIPGMYSKIKEGYDIVSGWRFKRKDKLFSRILPSMIANSIIAKSTGVKLHDYGCSLKIYNGDLLRDTRLYGEMHRFIPALIAQKGAKMTELKVNHHPRRAGKSKYGISRTFRVILDLVTVKFLGNFSTKPIHIFGGWGLFALSTGFLISLYLLIIRFFFNQPIGNRPLLTLGILLIFIGVQFITIGLIGEFLTRIYYESEDRKTYYVNKIVKK
ncbi:glycosyltransferase family 2 protein [bacterium]|nr:glycosyltransferase family 2 protein [bacterium]